MSRRTPDQVHDEDGHPEFVASCKRCQTEAEQDRNAEEARTELATGGVVSGVTALVGEPGCELPRPARLPVTTSGRPKCYVDDCQLPEFADDMGLCGAHWSNRPDLRKVARRG